MDFNNGKPLSPWKVPSRISLKRIRHKINSDLNVPNPLFPGNNENNSTKSSNKRNRFMMNKFALSRSISTPTSDEIIPNKTSNDEDLLVRLHQIIPSSIPISNNHIIIDSTINSFHQQESVEIVDEIISMYPIDWSLKCSCRFSSKNSSTFFSNLTKLRSMDESLALDYICSIKSTENIKAYFRSLTSYWIYPHIPWLKLFPRSQQQNINNTSSVLDEQSQLALQDEWKLSFQSLFQSFRCKICPYFYFCTQTFNILFCEDSSSQIISIISPTTSGFRTTLEREGIEFIITDNDENIVNSDSQTNDENEDDQTCEEWLQEMGLTGSTNSNCDQRRKSSKVLQRSKTILIRETSSINSLFNFLLNKSQKTCLTLTGPLTGIPPTLISPKTFLYSTLKYLNVHFQSNTMITIDDGPILPDRLKDLWNFFEKNISNLQMNCVHLERTSAFNYDPQISKTLKSIQTNENQQLSVQFA